MLDEILQTGHLSSPSPSNKSQNKKEEFSTPPTKKYDRTRINYSMLTPVEEDEEEGELSF
jgi:hypothetical protein